MKDKHKETKSRSSVFPDTRQDTAATGISQLYKALFDNAADGILVADIDSMRFHIGNNAICEMLGYSHEEIKHKGVIDIHPTEALAHATEQFKRLSRKEIVLSKDIPIMRKDGSIFYADIKAFSIQLNGETYIAGIFRDITERKKTEESLKEKERELEIKAMNLEELNTALKVLLKKRDEDRLELEEKVLLNIKELVLPYLDKIRVSGLDKTQNAYADILESNLRDIVSSFSYRLSSVYMNLTPSEITVANLVRQGRTNKEIADILNIAPRTAAFHRERIRKKLGIKNQKTNLKSLLSSMS
jgi:PAS domain S-box-containing protein